ncbi:MAG: hypothetical protein AB2806_08870 [Candidatus Thiodiazotropha sp.]
MADDNQEERRKLQTFRDQILPTVLSAFILSVAGGLYAISRTVDRHDGDLEHFKAKCHMLEARTSDYIVLQHKVDELQQQLKECRADIDRLEHR